MRWIPSELNTADGPSRQHDPHFNASKSLASQIPCLAPTPEFDRLACSLGSQGGASGEAGVGPPAHAEPAWSDAPAALELRAHCKPESPREGSCACADADSGPCGVGASGPASPPGGSEGRSDRRARLGPVGAAGRPARGARGDRREREQLVRARGREGRRAGARAGAAVPPPAPTASGGGAGLAAAGPQPPRVPRGDG